MHVCNKNSNIQRRSPIVESDFPYHKELLLKERIRSLWEQILYFKRSSHFEKGHNWREPLLDPVDSLWCGFWLRHWKLPSMQRIIGIGKQLDNN